MIEQIPVDAVIALSRAAGREILAVYGQEEFVVDQKADASPLTEADQRSHRVIAAGLTELTPDVPMISEEGRLPDYAERSAWSWFWMIDPLDGTKEFIKRNGEFTVNIALVGPEGPVFGVVYQPVGDHLYWGIVGQGAWKQTGEQTGETKSVPMTGGPSFRDKDDLVVVASRSHLGDDVAAFVADLEASGKKVTFLSAGSSLKLCLVAEGTADVYPRFGPTMEWDTAAAHAVAKAAGRKVVSRETGAELVYNKENLLNPHFLVE
jgi:3'(2'), 5'-bisphosphate nucleotidase